MIRRVAVHVWCFHLHLACCDGGVKLHLRSVHDVKHQPYADKNLRKIKRREPLFKHRIQILQLSRCRLLDTQRAVLCHGTVEFSILIGWLMFYNSSKSKSQAHINALIQILHRIYSKNSFMKDLLYMADTAMKLIFTRVRTWGDAYLAFL